MEGVDKRNSSAFGVLVAPRPTNQKIGIPPSHPNINIPPSTTPYSQHPQRLHSSGSSHSRSLSQPSIFSLDSFPPLSPSYDVAPSIFESISKTNMVTEESNVCSVSINREDALIPPRKGHRRSSSDSPLGISGFMQSSLVPFGRDSSGFEKPIQLILKASFKGNLDRDHANEPVSRGKEESEDDLFKEYMNLDSIDNMDFPGVEDRDVDNRTSTSTTVESNDNKVESHVNGKISGAQGTTWSCLEETREGVKRSSNGDIAPSSRHHRSFSLDSSIKNFNIKEGSPQLSPLKKQIGQHSHTNSLDGKTSETIPELGNVEFSADEVKKIIESDKLTEIASIDPKRAKRILANRQSAARSKERKKQYIDDLEQKVQTLQTETTTLSTQFTKLQGENYELKNENNECKLRLKAMEQQSQLKDALHETLDIELRHLRRAFAELGGESLTTCMARQIAINQQIFQLQNQQSNQQRHFLFQNHRTLEDEESQSEHSQAKESHPK